MSALQRFRRELRPNLCVQMCRPARALAPHGIFEPVRVVHHFHGSVAQRAEAPLVEGAVGIALHLYQFVVLDMHQHTATAVATAADAFGIDGFSANLSASFNSDVAATSGATGTVTLENSYAVGVTYKTTAGDSTVTIGAGYNQGDVNSDGIVIFAEEKVRLQSSPVFVADTFPESPHQEPFHTKRSRFRHPLH